MSIWRRMTGHDPQPTVDGFDIITDQPTWSDGMTYEEQLAHAEAYFGWLWRRDRISADPTIPDVADITPDQAADALRYEMPLHVTDHRHAGGAA